MRLVSILCRIILTSSLKGEGSKIQNQRFYRSTLEAMKAKEEAKHAKTKEKIQDAMAHPGSKPNSGNAPAKDDTVHPAVPAAKDKEEETEEISIAGRTKMTVPKNKNKDTGVQDPASNSGSEKSKEGETVDLEDAKSELNTILKKSPSMFFSLDNSTSTNILLLEANLTSSHHLFQVLLPLQQESQVDSARRIHHFTQAVRG